MKKSLFFLALALVALVSCDNDPKEYTTIKFKESTMEIEQGDTIRMSILWEPTSIATAPACTWTSSDTSVATVDGQGYIAAKAVGKTTITASYKGLTAICQVEVKSWMEMVEFSQFILAKADTTKTINDSIYEITLRSGYETKCKAYPGTWYVLDPGISLNESTGYLEGIGFVAELSAPVLIIKECKNDPTYVGAYIGSASIITEAAPSPDSLYYAEAGRIDDLSAYATAILNDITTKEEWDDYVATIQGSKIFYGDFDSGESTYYLGLWDTGFIVQGNDELYCKQNIKWFSDESYLGLKIAEDGKSLVTPYELVTTNIYYENLPEEQVARPVAKKFNTINMKNMTVSRELTQKVFTELRKK